MRQKAVEAHGLQWESPRVGHICLALDIKKNVDCTDPFFLWRGGGGSLGKKLQTEVYVLYASAVIY